MQLPPWPFWASCPCSYKGGRNFKELNGLVVSYSWVFQDESSQEMACPVKGLNLIATYSGRRRNSFSRCKKGTCEALTVICLLALEIFLPWYEYSYSQSGNNKLQSFVTSNSRCIPYSLSWLLGSSGCMPQYCGSSFSECNSRKTISNGFLVDR